MANEQEFSPTLSGEDVDESQTLEMLTRLISEVSDIDISDGLNVDASFADLGFDSMTQLELLSHIESELGIRIPDDRFNEIQSVRTIVGLVREFSNDRQDSDV